MQAEEALGPAALVREALDRQRGGGAREDRPRRQESVELGQQPRLDVVVLDDRLDHERRVRERAGVGHDLHVLGVDLRAEPAERLLDGRPGAVGRALRAGQQQHGPVVGGGRREAAGDRSASGYCEVFVHASSPLVCGSDGRRVID